MNGIKFHEGSFVENSQMKTHGCFVKSNKISSLNFESAPSKLQSMFVATPLWPSVGVKPNTWKSWGLGVLRDSRMFRARQQGEKHLALRRSWCHWKGLET
jgi:hypothetical protein